ncbi:MAG: DUF922 domain-containing Zn-dependent protease [Gammaproteobacteria bacterium]|mgnify:FL=1|nr:DUF922 domain-containing Zn-dependent protease [Gammaproteobacteria bacterium]
MFLKGFLITSFTLIASHAIAAPVITIQTEYFTVTGNDSNSLYQSLQKNGPIGENGDRYHAVTRWKARWSYSWRETSRWCQLSGVEVSLDIDYLLPKFKALESKPEHLKKSWDNYFQALFKHEQQHKDYGVQAANELEQALLAINERQACSTLQNNMADTAQQILDKYDQLEKEFDRVTNHGLNQGIKLQ